MMAADAAKPQMVRTAIENSDMLTTPPGGTISVQYQYCSHAKSRTAFLSLGGFLTAHSTVSPDIPMISAPKRSSHERWMAQCSSADGHAFQPPKWITAGKCQGCSIFDNPRYTFGLIFPLRMSLCSVIEP